MKARDIQVVDLGQGGVGMSGRGTTEAAGAMSSREGGVGQSQVWGKRAGSRSGGIRGGLAGQWEPGRAGQKECPHFRKDRVIQDPRASLKSTGQATGNPGQWGVPEREAGGDSQGWDL